MLNSKVLLANTGGYRASSEAVKPQGKTTAHNGRTKVGAMSGTSSSDSEFFEQESELASEWNPAYFDGVVTKYQPRLYRFIYSIIGEAETAHDLTQDTFLSAYKNLCKRAENPADYQTHNTNMTAWLYTIARNTALSELRRRKVVRFFSFWQRSGERSHHEEIDTMLEMPYQEPGGSLEAHTALSDELTQAIEKVGRERLTALFLYMDGFSYKEICEVTGSSLASVKSQIFRAKESLRKALGESDTLEMKGGSYE